MGNTTPQPSACISLKHLDVHTVLVSMKIKSYRRDWWFSIRVSFALFQGTFGTLWRYFGFLGGSVVKNLPGNAGDVGSVSGSGRSPGEGGDHALQHSWAEETGGLQSVGSQKNWTRLSDSAVRTRIV